MCKWYEGHGQSAPPRRLLPETGFINEAAIGMSYATDSSLVILDCLVTDPNNRHKSTHIDSVINHLLKAAKGLDVVVFCSDRFVIERLKKFEFFPTPNSYRMLIRG